MPDRDEQFKEAISDLANALQTALLLATRQKHGFGDKEQDATSLEAAIDRAVHAVGRLQRDGVLTT